MSVAGHLPRRPGERRVERRLRLGFDPVTEVIGPLHEVFVAGLAEATVTAVFDEMRTELQLHRNVVQQVALPESVLDAERLISALDSRRRRSQHLFELVVVRPVATDAFVRRTRRASQASGQPGVLAP